MGGERELVPALAICKALTKSKGYIIAAAQNAEAKIGSILRKVLCFFLAAPTPTPGPDAAAVIWVLTHAGKGLVGAFLSFRARMEMDLRPG